MKITTVPILLTLALCLTQVPDAASEDGNQETCNEFRALMKNGKLLCSQEQPSYESPGGLSFINRCVSCKVILEKEAKSEEKARLSARDTTPAKLNCDDFKKGERDGDFICTFDNAAVCGTNGKTYSNRCALCAENVTKGEPLNSKTRSQVDIKSEGECESRDPEQDLCSAFRPYVKDGRLGCTRENDPVLGPDGRTHGNKCAMCAELFLKEAEENAKKENETRNRRSAEKALCKDYESQVRNGRLYCTRESDPVRGPDGRMHGNRCALCAEVFKRRFLREKNEANENPREPEEKAKVRREIKKLCSEYENHAKNGMLYCTRENDPVRGPDGKMHGNLCSMCQAFYLAEAEERKMTEARSRSKRESEKESSLSELCSIYHKYLKNGKLNCHRKTAPNQSSEGIMNSDTCFKCAVFFRQDKRTRSKAKREAAEELCSEFRSQVRNGMLICTRENDPVRGPDGKMHGNKCAMCASVFKLEEEKKNNGKEEKEKVEADKVKREAVEELCNEYRNYVRNGRLACTRENDPIEGPDGKIHGNTCSMCEAFFQQEAKEKEAESRAKTKRETEKDACSEFRGLLQNGNLYCTRENDPVRGPDGKTHGNKCAMCKAVFQKEDEDRKRKEEEDQRTAAGHGSNGGGGKVQDQCAEYRESMKDGKLSCTRESDPVRDANGKSYNNKCAMCKELLQREANEKDKHSSNRSNGTDSSSGKDECDEFRSQMKNGQLICTRESDPVRGPNGKTHGNKCAMCKEKLEREAAEKKKKEEDTRNRGKNDQCHEFRSQVRDGRLICTRENDPVRDPYGKMHVNKCAMCQSIFEREASERKQNDEEKQRAKPTNDAKDECSNFQAYLRNDQLLCTRENDPVRGADGKIYKNRCYMCRNIFQKAREKAAYVRSSEEKGSTEHPRSSLDSEMCKQYRVVPRMGYLCPKNLQPVCGDDGQTYNNPCMLCHENLIRQTNTHILSEGPCTDTRIPGTTPLSRSASEK